MSTPNKRTKDAGLAALPKPTPEQMAAEIADLGLEVETLKSKLKETTAKRDQHAAALDELQAHAAAQAAKLDELKNELLVAHEDRERKQAEITGLERETARLSAELAEQKRNNAMIMAELGDVAKQRDAAKQQAEEAQAAREEWEAHPFFGMVHQLNKQCGEVSAELVEHTDRVIEAANDTGKPGKIVLTVAVKPSDEHARALIAAAKVTSTLPKADPAKAVFFIAAGKVTGDDPAQPKLPMTVPEMRRPAPTAADKELERRLATAKPAVVVPDECPEVPAELSEDYDRVLTMAMEGEKLTVAAIQRRLGIGYNRALSLFALNEDRQKWQQAQQ